MQALSYEDHHLGNSSPATEKDLDISFADKNDLSPEAFLAPNGVQPVSAQSDTLDEVTRVATIEYYSGKAEDQYIAPRGDFEMLVGPMMGLSVEEAVQILVDAISYHEG